MASKKIVVLSLGGSIVVPPSGLDVNFLKKFKATILGLISKGYRFIIVCGGGQTARSYQAVAKKIGELLPDDVDWIGIHATRLNAHLLRSVFKKQSNRVVVKNPTEKINWQEKVLIAAGWKPGFSTDYDAVCLAKNFGSDTVINLSNVDYVYDSDPRKNLKAKKLKNVGWKEFRKIVGDKWNPGANLPFDPVAAKMAEKEGVKVFFIKGQTLEELKKAISGDKFKGTVIGG